MKSVYVGDGNGRLPGGWKAAVTREFGNSFKLRCTLGVFASSSVPSEFVEILEMYLDPGFFWCSLVYVSWSLWVSKIFDQVIIGSCFPSQDNRQQGGCSLGVRFPYPRIQRALAPSRRSRFYEVAPSCYFRRSGSRQVVPSSLGTWDNR